MWEALSKTRCEYIPVRSAPPSLAPHGFGKGLPHGRATSGDRKPEPRGLCTNVFAKVRRLQKSPVSRGDNSDRVAKDNAGRRRSRKEAVRDLPLRPGRASPRGPWEQQQS